MTNHSPGSLPGKSDSLVKLVMSNEAALRFREVLIWAQVRAEDESEDERANGASQKADRIAEHGDWLRWAVSRLDEARRSVATG